MTEPGPGGRSPRPFALAQSPWDGSPVSNTRLPITRRATAVAWAVLAVAYLPACTSPAPQPAAKALDADMRSALEREVRARQQAEWDRDREHQTALAALAEAKAAKDAQADAERELEKVRKEVEERVAANQQARVHAETDAEALRAKVRELGGTGATRESSEAAHESSETSLDELKRKLARSEQARAAAEATVSAANVELMALRRSAGARPGRELEPAHEAAQGHERQARGDEKTESTAATEPKKSPVDEPAAASEPARESADGRASKAKEEKDLHEIAESTRSTPGAAPAAVTNRPPLFSPEELQAMRAPQKTKPRSGEAASADAKHRSEPSSDAPSGKPDESSRSMAAAAEESVATNQQEAPSDVADDARQPAVISGAVERPGPYPIHGGDASVARLIFEAGGIEPGVQRVRVEQGRAGAEPTRLELAVDQILTSKLAAMKLAPGDTVTVRPVWIVKVEGAVKKPGSYTLLRTPSIANVIEAAGGTTKFGKAEQAEIKRADGTAAASGDETIHDGDVIHVPGLLGG